MKHYFYLLIAFSLLAGINTHAQIATPHHPIERPQPGKGRVQGNISMPDNATTEQWRSATGNKLDIEVWRVNYAPDKTDRNFSDIYLMQKINVAVTFQNSPTGLQYTLQGLPALSNLVVIVYATGVPAGSAMRMFGRPFDGQPGSRTHQFRSDAKKQLGQNILYGIYSLTGQSENYTNIDFRIIQPDPHARKAYDVFDDLGNAVSDLADDVSKFVKATINGVEHIFDQTIDGVSGLAKCAVNDIQGIADATNFFINQAGAYFYLTAAGLINLIQYGNLPRMRDMSIEEYAWANARMFNNTLPPIDQIKIFNFMNLQGDHHRCFTWPAPAGNYIYVNIGDAFDNTMTYTNSGYPAPGQVFIHELTHAWQCGKYGFGGMVQRYFAAPGGMNQTYDPGCGVNNINSNFDLEQQATMVDRSYASIYFPDAIVNYNCSFDIPWVERTIRNGVNFDMNMVLASREMQKAAGIVGGIANGQTFHSNGNREDGDGYFMLGRNTNSFLYYSSKTRVAAANWGAIRDRFTRANYEFGELGWPVRSEALLPDAIGYYQKFDHGFIYWHPKYGTYVILNNIFDPWAKDGWEKGKLGYPISDYIAETATAGYQKFVGGIIYYSQNSQPSTSIRYGNPAMILAEFKQKTTNNVNGLRTINPQPLPPIARKNR